MTPVQFKQALQDTFTWVAPRMNPSNVRWSMRSMALRPPHDYYRDENPGFFNDSKYITHVADTRRKLLRGKSAGQLPAPIGRLLLVDYKETNHNEATEHESNGFFDWADNPPWDLWIGEHDKQLIAWIPDQFVDLVVRSEQVECTGMFHWAEDLVPAGRIPHWLHLSLAQGEPSAPPARGAHVV
jgi:hypothetical protein